MAGCTDKLAARMNLSFLKPPPLHSVTFDGILIEICCCFHFVSYGNLEMRVFPFGVFHSHWSHTTSTQCYHKIIWPHQLDVHTRPLRLMFPNHAALWVQWKELSHCVISFKQMIMMGHVGLSGISRHNTITWAVKTSLRRQWMSPAEEGPVLVSHNTFGLRPFGPFFACLV